MKRFPGGADNARVFELVSAVVLLASLGTQEPAELYPPEQAPPERPKIALVLSGGGARGAAHIGVIKVLEELHVPIDLITGTSMGAIVGGLYASGMPIDEIERELLAIDWDDVFRDKPSRRDLDFRRKQDEGSFRIDLNLGIKHGKLTLPSGVIQGQKLNLILKDLTLPMLGVDSFDDYPIPFRAVAADIADGEAVVLDHGDLAAAIRASMSIPGAIAPQTIDGRLLVDGMIANNIPIDVAKGMGADIVIAVNVSTLLADLDQQASFLGISSQVLTILMRRNVNEQVAFLADGDVLLTPDLQDLTPTDFTRANEAITRGESAAREHAGALSALGLPPADYAGLRERQLRGTYEPPIIRDIKVDTDADLSPKAITSRMRTKPGERLDLDVLYQDLGRIYGISIFEQVDFSLEEDPEGTDLLIRARQKTWGPPYLRFKAFLADDFDGSASYVVGTRLTFMPVNSYGAEWRNEIEVGDLMRLSSEFFQPIAAGSPYFVAPRVELIRTDVDAFDDGNKLAELELSAFVGGVDVGRLLGNWGEFRVGMFHLEGDIDVETGPAGFDPGNLSETRANTGILVDTLDEFNFPRHGVFGGAFLTFARESLGSDENFDLLETSANHVFSFGPNTLIYGAQYATAIDDEVEATDTFELGGFLNLSGLERNSIRGQHSLLARVVGYRQIGWERRTPFGIPYYLGGSLELGNVFDDRDDIQYDNLLFSGSVFLGLDTFFGPIYIGYGLTEGGDQAAFLFAGGLPF